MIETYLLEHLVAFKNCRTLSEAAEKLHLTQPTLTRSMNKLEECFGVPLFTREKKRLYLNDNGTLAAEYAESILSTQAKMLSQVRTLDRISKTVNVGSCAPGPIMELLPRITSTFSTMTVSSKIADEDSLVSGLKEKTYQMIILNHPMDSSEYFCEKCGSEQLCASLIPSHPLADRAKLSFSDMNGESFLMASEVGMWEDIVRRMMPKSKFLLQGGPDTLFEVASSSTLSGFATDLTLRILGGRLNRINIPFSDPESFTEYFCICLASEKEKYERWFQSIKR